MAFHIRAYTVVVAPFLVSISAACAVLLARVFVRRRSRNAVLLVLEARAYEIFDVFVKAASGSTNMPEREEEEEEEGTCVEVTISWKNAKLLRVPTLLLDDGHLDLMDLFEVYSGLLKNKSSDELLIFDLWNCLIAVVRHHLRCHVKADNALLLDEMQAEGLLAVCILLRGKYAITKSSLLLNGYFLVEKFPEGLFQHFLSAYRKKSRSDWDYFLFKTCLEVLFHKTMDWVNLCLVTLAGCYFSDTCWVLHRHALDVIVRYRN
ncbi:ABC transporter, putative [Trypanosoma cruzi marinkellei]|uniref:ABC transporter, putative n=1 Tax=Trypanosoma cruzi marinkellei TaxID=85056 RepID=K2MDQ3_TRYCR|nr:ABC transporter, putative [Trypanosoma cruzi marinkellei]